MPSPRSRLRRELLDQRNAMAPLLREEADAAIRTTLGVFLDSHFAAAARATIACYWPIQGEPDLRPLWANWRQVALPVVVAPGAPLRFALWTPDTVMSRGPFGVAIPKECEWVQPTVIVVPCVGFYVSPDSGCFRLGYGGGYYDRTLEEHRLPCVGIAYAQTRLAQFEIGQHDVPLDAIITQTLSFGLAAT